MDQLNKYNKPEKLFNYPGYDKMVFDLIKNSKSFRIFTVYYLDQYIKAGGKNPIQKILKKYRKNPKKFVSEFDKYRDAVIDYYEFVMKFSKDIVKIPIKDVNIENLRRFHKLRGAYLMAESQYIVNFFVSKFILAAYVVPLFLFL